MIFLKLGGSLITDKGEAETPRLDVLARLAQEIAEARSQQPEMQLLLGHGSGSFGHPEAARHGTRAGARSPEDWRGFQKVWWSAHRLHRHVLDSLAQAGLPVLSFPPSTSALCDAGELMEMATGPIIRSLEARLLPLVQGDVAFDRSWGATIVSTEQAMGYLARLLRPSRVLLAGAEAGVYARFPATAPPLGMLSRGDLAAVKVGASVSADVTGGMADKVDWGLRLAAEMPGVEVRIFSGSIAGNVRGALLGGSPGTLLSPG